ncbi:hypothetical protein LLEC1_05886 [Akanthomyces lecanii]|uniref:Uncharacterized protein n=1 Tax=Cordyceps confragosa TaxID=2714763 RepID=A0A179IH14_CORDF|nr:hypothetical protein LLEC1_05886 [Akanthomyces lecanii]
MGHRPLYRRAARRHPPHVIYSSTQRLLEIDSEIEQLRKRNSDLEVANRTNLNSIVEERQKADADRAIVLRELKEQKEKVQSLHGAETKAEKLDRQIKEQEKGLLSQVEAIKKKSAEVGCQQTLYERTKEELEKEKVKPHRSEQQPADDEAGVDSHSTAMFDNFHQFLDMYKAELSIDVAADTAPAAAIEKLGLPLPASNSAAAENMGIAAALAVTGKALVEHVFQQTLVDPDSDLHRVLDRLAVDDTEHEAYVRAVLLRLVQELPADEQRAMHDASIAGAVEEIVTALEPWTPQAALKDKIEVDFLFQVLEEWRAVPLEKKPTTASATSNNKSHVNTPKQPAARAQTQQSSPATLSKKQVAKVVWPVFMALLPDEDPPEIVSCGYVLTKAHMREAEEEVADEESTYKQARQSLRRKSTTQKKKTKFAGRVVSAGLRRVHRELGRLSWAESRRLRRRSGWLWTLSSILFIVIME